MSYSLLRSVPTDCILERTFYSGLYQFQTGSYCSVLTQGVLFIWNIPLFHVRVQYPFNIVFFFNQSYIFDKSPTSSQVIPCILVMSQVILCILVQARLSLVSQFKLGYLLYPSSSQISPCILFQASLSLVSSAIQVIRCVLVQVRLSLVSQFNPGYPLYLVQSSLYQFILLRTTVLSRGVNLTQEISMHLRWVPLKIVFFSLLLFIYQVMSLASETPGLNQVTRDNLA